MPFTAHIPTLKQLHKLAFGDSDAYIDFFFEQRFSPENCFLHFENGVPVGALYARIFRLRIQDKKVHVPFFTGIATHPDHRRKGIAAGLIRQATETYAARGYPLVLLHPFNVDFYKKQGFAPVNFTVEHTARYTPNPAYTARPMRTNDMMLFKKLYDAETKRAGAHRISTLLNLKELWREHTQDGGVGYIILKNGEPNGYFLCDDKKIYEHSFSYPSSADAVREADGLTGMFFAPAGTPYSMGRAANLRVLFQNISYPKNANGSFLFSVDGRPYRLIVENGVCTRCRREVGIPTFSMERGMLAALALGHRSTHPHSIPHAFLDLFPRFQLVLHETY